jgi:ABC-type sugar transport system substrate-binding protein
MRWLKIALFFSVPALLFAGCVNNPALPVKAAPSPQKDKTVIGVSVLDLDNPYYIQIVKGIKSKAEEFHMEVEINDSESDSNQQLAAIKKFVDQNVDVIIVAALNPLILEDTLKQAMDKGIKVIAQSTCLENCNIFIAAEEWEMGYTIGCGAGQWIRDKLNGEAEVGIIDYPRIPQIINREKGIKDGLEEFSPHAVIVDSQQAGNPYEGEQATQEMLKNHLNINAIVSVNDAGALGAFNIVQKTGKDKNLFFIGGVDATPEALDKIKDDTIYRATVDISPYLNGEIDVNFANKLIKGQIVPYKYSIDSKLVTRENIQFY